LDHSIIYVRDRRLDRAAYWIQGRHTSCHSNTRRVNGARGEEVAATSMKKGLSMTTAQVEAHNRRHGFLTDTMLSPASPVVAQKKIRGSRQPNKTEAEFGRILKARKRAGEFDSVTFEAVKLRIAGNCYYTPDWMTWDYEWAAIIFYEVKGSHIWDDSKVKFKAAKELHPWASFEMWQKKAGNWSRIL
ncbi:MAG TPA: hypothetical protein VF333_09965, partial [Pyrinomonadaceae bacterium]